ncbi:Methionine adenosyltransferase 2 subunit beta like [Actinidia chinensis var. chinensis]|uniref:Methionine adenosyltransferase 2 subunit beta like n=1 Tax=Actinidia chinensis var. chinensis TaxID=1590841 RepID=A0A2R6R9Y3_ACTCC|nr:Methionine adenosyltransferase 2 subunit beta like [Actinidia chinensis var. chinensis]
MSKKRVLVVGGTGYLGQHLLKRLSEIQSTNPHDVSFTYHSNPPPQPLLKAIPQALAFHVDLRTGHGFDAISQAFGQPHVVVNCAALSVPRTCEMDPTAAMSINMPSALVKWLSSFTENNTLLIHLSTDQVYEGVKSFYKEDDETVPVNVYGRSKVEGEQFISANCSNFAILRSSIIFGPQTVSPVPKSLPIQWMDSVLSKGDKMEFFHDEFRCPVYVKDVVTVILTLTDKWISEGKQMQVLLNIGGPDRVSRAQMAEAVAHIRGYNNSLITPVSASTVDRGVKSPADISMDISKLIQTLGISPIPFGDGVRLTLAAEAGS